MGDKRAMITVGVATMAFGCAVLFRNTVNPWLSTTAAAAVALWLAGSHTKSELRALLRTPWRAKAGAIAFGLLLAAATHIAFGLANIYAPALTRGVPELYSAIQATPGPVYAIPLVILIVFAEEVVWRGLVIHELNRRIGPTLVFVVAVLLYVLPQLVSGSWELIVVAAMLGCVFVWQRLTTGRLGDPFVTHLVWSVAVFVVFPVAKQI